MARVDFSRDYYAELGVPQNAEVKTIKDQFKKLAIQYHPDKHPDDPNKESYAAKFAEIRSAYEILSDPASRKRYDDAKRPRVVYPSASGVRGNPWQNAGSQFPKPPSRQPNRPKPTSGATRYSTYAQGMPSSPKEASKVDPRASAYAWEQMRPNSRGTSRAKASAGAGSAGGSAQKPEQRNTKPADGPTTPRMKTQRQSAFGTSRRTGFTPHSPLDEEPVDNKNYFTTKSHTTLFANASSSAKQTRKVPPPPGDPLQRAHESFLDPRQSMPYQSSTGEKTDPFDSVPLERVNSQKEREDGKNGTSRQRQRSASVPDDPENMTQTGRDANGLNDGKGSQFRFSSHGRRGKPGNAEGESSEFPNSAPPNTTFGPNVQQAAQKESQRQPDKGPEAFTFSFDHTAESPSTPDSARFMRPSAEGIDTRFATENFPANWQFNAGSPSTEVPRTRSGTRLGRRSPVKGSPVKDRYRQRQESVASSNEASVDGPTMSGFNADEWKQKFGDGPDMFAPQPSHSASVSPTRAGRAGPKKAKSTRFPKSASVVDEGETSDEEAGVSPSRSSSGHPQPPTGTSSPNAMDIDSPPLATSDKKEARSIPVEPTRQEWRAGNINYIGADTQTGAKINVQPQQLHGTTTGSEDSEEFRASFSDFRKVEPFNVGLGGLDSFSDLKSKLPFESKPSAKIPLSKEKRKEKVPFPPHPSGPRPPPTLAITSMRPNEASWNKYRTEFQEYMRQWDNFNTRVVDHFKARQQLTNEMGKMKDYAWLNTRDDSGILEYATGLEQDQEIRTKWNDAVADHQQRVQEFMTFRERMK